jgi:hypothetical protein
VTAAGPTGPSRAQGWCQDPTGRHDHRWYSEGWPTLLVRDGDGEGYDPLEADDANVLAASPTSLPEQASAARASRPTRADSTRPVGTVGNLGHLASVDPVRALGPIRTPLIIGIGAAWAAIGVWGDNILIILTGGSVAGLGAYWALRGWRHDRHVRRMQHHRRAESDPNDRG